MIKLSRKTLNAEVIIINANTTLNSNNLHYTLNDSSIEKLNLEIGNESALIEILFKNDDNFTDIIDLTGKVVKEVNDSEANISNLSKGIYIVNFYSGDNVISRKIVKK